MVKKFKLSIQHLWPITVVVGIFIFTSTHPIRPQDFWWHMAVGREIISSGQIPLVDSYSFTMPGQAYPSYQMFWLMEVVMYLVYRLGGGELVIFLHSFVITGAYSIILWLCYQVSRSWRIAAFGVLFAAALGLNDWNVRPQAVTFFLGALILFAINRVRLAHSKAWLVVIPLSMVLWVNSHGTFPIGLAMLGVWWLEEAWMSISQINSFKERLLLPTMIVLIGGVACLLNPQGFGIVHYVRTLTGSQVVQDLVPEWAPPSFETIGGTIFLIGFLISACILALSPKRPSFSQMAYFILFSLLGLKTMRGVIWFGMIIAPVLADHLNAIIMTRVSMKQDDSIDVGSTRLNRIFVIVLLLLAFFSLPWFKKFLPLPPLKAGIFSYETPIDATRFLLEEELPGPLFHSMSFGSYLIWEAQPDYPVFVDSRIELYDYDIWRDYILASSGGCDWQIILDRYDIQTIMAGPVEQAGLISSLDNSQSWLRVYTDPAAVIFTRK